MPSCREIDPLVRALHRRRGNRRRAGHRRRAPAGVPEVPAPDRAAVGGARARFATKLCRPCAPEALRTRCRAAARAGMGPFGTTRSTLASLSMAAALVFVVGGVLLYTLTGLSPAVLAAQLTLDHVKCFAVHDADAPVDVARERGTIRARLRRRDSPAARGHRRASARRHAPLLLRRRAWRRTRCIA